MRAGYLAGNFFPSVQLNSLRNPLRDGLRRRKSSAFVSRDHSAPASGPAEAPETPLRCAFRRRAARTSRSASPEPGWARSPPPQAEKPRNSEAGARARLPLHPLARKPRLARPGDLRDSRREGLLRRGADQQRLEKCQNQGQQAASSHLRDRRSIPPPSPAGERNGAGNRGRRRRSTLCRDRGRLEGWRAGAGARSGAGAAGAKPARGKGRRRAAPLERAGCSAPRLPRLRRHQGRLWKQTWASPPALRRSRYLALSPSLPLSVSSLIYSPDCREGGGGGEGGGGVTALGGGEGGWRNGGMAGGETCGRERLRLASPGKSGGGGRGWAAGGLGVRAVGRRRARSSTPYKAERNSQSRRRLAPAAQRAEGERTQPRGAPGGQLTPSGHPQAAEAPAQRLAYVFGGYFCIGRQRSPRPSPRRRIHCLPRSRGEVIRQPM